MLISSQHGMGRTLNQVAVSCRCPRLELASIPVLDLGSYFGEVQARLNCVIRAAVMVTCGCLAVVCRDRQGLVLVFVW